MMTERIETTSDAECGLLGRAEIELPLSMPPQANFSLSERLSRRVVAIDHSAIVSEEQARAIMDQRARELAKESFNPIVQNRLKILQFNIADELYGIETRHVREVVSLAKWTSIPKAPPSLAGVINLRGEIIALFDLTKLFGLSNPPSTNTCHVLVIGEDAAEFGILANGIHGVSDIPSDEVMEIPETLCGTARDFVQGVTRDALILLNGSVLINDPRLVIDQGAEFFA